MAVDQGFATQLGISAANPTTDRFEFKRCTIAERQTNVTDEGVSGNRSRLSGRAAIASRRSSGEIELNPTVVEIDKLLPWILGGTTSGGITDVADALPSRFVQVDKVRKVYTYDSCVVSSLRIDGSEGQPLNWTIGVEGKAEATGNAGTFPALSIDTGNFFMMHQCTLTLNAVAYNPKSFGLSLSNQLDTERFLNSVTRDFITPQDRIVTLDVVLPAADAEALYALATIMSTGIAGSLAFTNGTVTYTIAFANLKCAVQGVEVPGRSELFYSWSFQAFRTASASEFKVTKV